ncbi:MAG: hypothetical protein HQL58_06050 [Magnetococcales bacterium]|nr:hypothetical protein [Magnetococcales bacterium]
MTAIREQFEAWNSRFIALSRRERLILISGVMLAGLVAWDALHYTPWEKKMREISQQQDDIHNRIEMTLNKQREVQQRVTMDPDKEWRAERDKLQKHLAEVREKLDRATRDLVMPQQMTHILEQVLLQDSKLKLLEITSMPVVQIMADEEKDKDKDKDKEKDKDKDKKKKVVNPNEIIYQHGTSLLLEGDYISLLNYLKKLENMAWVIYWDRLEYIVTDYPKAIIRIMVHTISRSQDWVGT